MIKKILYLISQGNTTFNEISQKLGISYLDLMNRLEMMERMKYIEIVPNENCNLDLGCACCSMPKKGCSNGTSDFESSVVYRITDKGKKVCGI